MTDVPPPLWIDHPRGGFYVPRTSPEAMADAFERQLGLREAHRFLAEIFAALQADDD